jgi:Ras-related protein Rab-33B
VPRILIGNKLDCGEQIVPTNVAQKFADMHNMPLFETSALDDSQANHVESIFMTLAHKLKASKPMMGPTSETPPSIVLHRADVAGVEHSSNPEDAVNNSSCMC